MDRLILSDETAKEVESLVDSTQINNILHCLVNDVNSEGNDTDSMFNNSKMISYLEDQPEENYNTSCSSPPLTISSNTLVAEALGKNTKILKYIMQCLTNPKDRRNIEVVSKNIYSLSNDLTSHIPLSNCEIIQKQFINEEKGKYQFIVNGKEVILNILDTIQLDDCNYKTLQKIVEKHIPNMESLYFMTTPSNYYEIFKDLNCFDRIKTVKIDLISLQKSGIRIFKECPSLKPDDIHIKNVLSQNIGEIYDSVEYQLPSSVRNIYFESNPESLEWLLRKISYHSIGHFDNFYMSKYVFEKVMVTGAKSIFLKVIKYFKKISYCNGDFYASPFDVDVGKVLFEYGIETIVNVYFSKNKIIKNVLDSPEGIRDFDRIRGSTLMKNKYRFLGQKGVYLNVSKLIISDMVEARKFHPFSCYELQFLKEDLEKMKKLKNLEIDLNLFKSFPDFRSFLCAIKSEVHSLKIGECSTIMSYYLPEIKRYCGKLEYLYLVNVGPYTTVTINDVFNQIKGLKGLKIKFNDFYNFKYILEDLETEVDGKKVLKWPNIDFLNVVCPPPDVEYRERIRQIEYNTPRRSGKFMLKDIVYNKKNCYQIIIQRSTKLYDEVEKIFNTSF